MKILLGDCLEVLRGMEDNSVDSIVTDPPYGISFMGKKWDYDVPKVEVWEEVLRVLKPGGHILCACGTRTQHRMAVNLEDAGFEIRDIVAWVYGSGFPKSLNIGKAVDKLQGNEREKIGKNPNYRPISGKIGYLEQSNFRQTEGMSVSTKGNSPHEGWGTALKPAMELWTLCRKPLEEKTVAENVLRYGTGGINIDGCRVGTTGARFNGRNVDSSIYGKYGTDKPKEDYNTGRFPANLIHDGSDEVVGLFPQTKSGGGNKNSVNNQEDSFLGTGFGGTGTKTDWKIDSGSASRFFYCAKASKSERNKGLEGFEEKKGGEITGRKDGSAGAKCGGYAGITETPRANVHPTVKPVKLMQYLCRLITPKEGIVLDPFMGSGTTGIGAKLEGFDFIGIEMNEEYLEIAKARIEGWEEEPQLNML